MIKLQNKNLKNPFHAKGLQKMKENKNQETVHEAIHKLSNLLTNINLSIELLTKGLYGSLNDQQTKCLKSMLSDGKKIKNLIKDIELEYNP